jgi:hypothetical protein
MKTIETQRKLDITNLRRDEVKSLIKNEGLSKTTYYRSLKRGWMIVTSYKTI